MGQTIFLVQEFGFQAESTSVDRPRGRSVVNQKESELSERIDRLRKEINKRRTRMENEAEDLCGLPTPWRKSRMKSHLKGLRVANTTDGAKADEPKPKVINPAEISLGGDAVIWTDKSEKVSDLKKGVI
ncbi:hypothetical protein KIN20_028882 [Parelaphostrongylus tenuis]|uniref:Uncharacterized protein n=1 Tax=Parelaphostrongylus tenuis TaxID=148309 RepID=A0AAD5R1S4_PARTN|nr:hypothetical protein KIN20_028882 [Parelaphostrongylus tenuis]